MLISTQGNPLYATRKASTHLQGVQLLSPDSCSALEEGGGSCHWILISRCTQPFLTGPRQHLHHRSVVLLASHCCISGRTPPQLSCQCLASLALNGTDSAAKVVCFSARVAILKYRYDEIPEAKHKPNYI